MDPNYRHRANSTTPTDYAGQQPPPPPHFAQRMQPPPGITPRNYGVNFPPGYPPHPEELHAVSPDHVAPHQALRVPIPPSRPPVAQHAGGAGILHPSAPTPPGPMSSNYVIPARPRPGRKPIPQEDAADRRRLQNRMAQRNFRDKRQQKVIEMQRELEKRKKEYEGDVGRKERSMDEMRTKMQEDKKIIAELRTEQLNLKARAEQAEKHAARVEEWARSSTGLPHTPTRDTFLPGAPGQLPPFNMTMPPMRGPMPTRPLTAGGGMVYGTNVPTPPEEDVEIDFTHAFRRYPQQHVRHSSSHESMTWNPEYNVSNTGNPCGFCTDPGNCACEQQSSQQQNTERPAVAPPASGGGCSTGGQPGTCGKCRTDPFYAQKCRELHSAIDFQRPSTSEGPRMYGPAGPMSLAPPQQREKRISCSELIGRLEPLGARNASISELFGNQQLQMHGYPSMTGGFTLDDREAVEALHRLSTSTPSRGNTAPGLPESNERRSR